MSSNNIINQNTIIIKYQDFVPDIRREEYEALKNSIKDKGLHLPIIVNQKNNVLLDGHHRYRVCQELGIEPRFETKMFEDEFEEKEFVIEINLKRRQLPEWEKLELALKLEDIYKEKAIIRRFNNLKNVNVKEIITSSSSLSMLPNDSVDDDDDDKNNNNKDDNNNEEEGRVVEIVSKKLGLSPRKIYRYKNVMKNGSEEIQEKVKSGQMSVSYADKSIRRAQSHQQTSKLPEGKYDIIVADPPWSYDINTRGSPDDHYDVMTNEDIYNLNVPSADNAILFLWATAPKLQEALNTIEKWGFTYKTHMVWIKDKIGTGYYARFQHEDLLIGEKGDMPVPQEENRPPSVFHAIREGHSKKPDIIYEIIEMYPNRTYLELFARRKRENWNGWGNELQ
jgi:N6-adenosine-specific RNA methylase IME4